MVLCCFRSFSLSSYFLQYGVTVVPVIGILYDKRKFNPVANDAEVEAIFYAPLEMFLKVLS